MLRNYFLAFVPIFVAVDAIGMLPIFIGLTYGMSEPEKRRLIRDSTAIALFVSMAFLWLGQLVFEWLGITISDFMVAGGAILFMISIRDLVTFHRDPGVSRGTMGVVPLAMPLMVGPAVLTTSLILLNSFGMAATLFSIVANLLLCAVILSFSGTLLKTLGEAGAHTLSKISQLLLAAIGVMLIRRGFFDLLTAWIASLPKS